MLCRILKTRTTGWKTSTIVTAAMDEHHERSTRVPYKKKKKKDIIEARFKYAHIHTATEKKKKESVFLYIFFNIVRKRRQSHVAT